MRWMGRVDGKDDGGGGRDDGRRYFPLIFLLFTSYFSLSFEFCPLFFLTFQKTGIKRWRSFRVSEEICSKCEVLREGIHRCEGNMENVVEV